MTKFETILKRYLEYKGFVIYELKHVKHEGGVYLLMLSKDGLTEIGRVIWKYFHVDLYPYYTKELYDRDIQYSYDIVVGLLD
jgi:hypothetical protein